MRPTLRALLRRRAEAAAAGVVAVMPNCRLNSRMLMQPSPSRSMWLTRSVICCEVRSRLSDCRPRLNSAGEITPSPLRSKARKAVSRSTRCVRNTVCSCCTELRPLPSAGQCGRATV